MRLHTVLFLIITFALIACQSKKTEKVEVKEDWVSLFNGVDLSGWTIKFAGEELNRNFKNTFYVEDSILRISYDNYETFDNKYAHLYYEQPYDYYKLKFDYRFVGEQTKGGASWNVRNSGIMLHSQSAESNDFDQHFPVSIELQLLGGLGEGERTTANVCTPGTAVVMGDTVNYTHCINSSSETYHGDQWVHAEAIVMGGEYMAFLVEGDTVLKFDKPQVGGGFISNANNRDDWADFGVADDKNYWLEKDGEILTSGYIALQAESHPIDFKNIELLNLCGCMDTEAKNYKPYYVKNDLKACEY